MPDAAAFWAWSLAVYRRPSVADALIRLQDAQGADVNLLLCCGWCAVTGRPPLDKATLESLIEQAAPWRRRVVEPLRALRRDMKGGIAGVAGPDSESLRDEVKRVEIAAERIEQSIFATALPPARGPGRDEARAGGGGGEGRGDPAVVARISLDAYIAVLGVGAIAAVEHDLAAIIDAFCAEIPPSPQK